MSYIESIIRQEKKTNYAVCGDTCVSSRNEFSTFFVLCDGVGSGVYANIASICCASRLKQLFECGVSVRQACEMVADSMHAARTGEIPFAAFSAVHVLNDGQFSIYTYESPGPFLVRDSQVSDLKPHYFNVGYEVLGETFGTLELGDSLIVCSDGVTQAGLGRRYPLGVGEERIAQFMDVDWDNEKIGDRLQEVVEYSRELSGDRYADDTTIAALHYRPARELTIATGPPAMKSRDKVYVDTLMQSRGVKVVCGSTTSNIVARVLDKEVEYIPAPAAFSRPPEYRIEGVDIVTEGAVMLNQVYNILEEDPELLTDGSVVEVLCHHMHNADVITFLIGGALNDAHENLVFKQMGVRPRAVTVRLIIEALRKMDKLVIVKQF
ncbi:MAG: SpoIIE family protein phosphatase [Bacillota bacterium]|nr:SpoIIE family protein phosphatase [Bacillota bacterium]